MNHHDCSLVIEREGWRWSESCQASAWEDYRESAWN